MAARFGSDLDVLFTKSAHLQWNCIYIQQLKYQVGTENKESACGKLCVLIHSSTNLHLIKYNTIKTFKLQTSCALWTSRWKRSVHKQNPTFLMSVSPFVVSFYCLSRPYNSFIFSWYIFNTMGLLSFMVGPAQTSEENQVKIDLNLEKGEADPQTMANIWSVAGLKIETQRLRSLTRNVVWRESQVVSVITTWP